MGRGVEVKALRDKMGMNRREFSEYFGIPYRTVQDWEAEKRELPDYLLRLMKYKVETEKLMKKWKEEKEHSADESVTEDADMVADNAAPYAPFRK